MHTALRLAVFALLAGTIAACGSDDTGDDSGMEVIEVTYDGTACTSNAPASVPAGEQSIVLINTSDQDTTELLVRGIEDGHTYQELVDLQNEAGGPGTEVARPEWVLPTPLIAPPSELSDTEMQYEFDLQAGGVQMVLAPRGQLWLCGGFEAVDG